MVKNIKPFVKWAGGKRQIVHHLFNNMPKEVIKDSESFIYIEPFVGGGALFFHLVSKGFKFRKVILNDINKDLMNAYRIIKEKPYELIKELEKITNEFFSLNEEERKKYYYQARELFNKLKKEENNLIKSSALFIFLNKTCYNGLFRVNKRGNFNVPYGRYRNPKIFDKRNLLKISKVLRNVILLNEDFEAIEEYVDDKTFIYFDPPYKPINKTSSFTSYNSKEFDDKEQIRLSEFFKKLDKKGAKLMLSNSCVLDFFNKLFSGFKIKKINARRMINSKGDKRSQEVCELIITNY